MVSLSIPVAFLKIRPGHHAEGKPSVSHQHCQQDVDKPWGLTCPTSLQMLTAGRRVHLRQHHMPEGNEGRKTNYMVIRATLEHTAIHARKHSEKLGFSFA